jgi:hypothetical protein
VVERNAQALESLSREMNYQLSGEVSDESSLSIGKQLGAQVIISGILARSGQNWRLDLQALQVESAQIAGQWSVENIRPDPSWASIPFRRTAAISFAGDTLSLRDRQIMVDGLENALEIWKTTLELDEDAVSGYKFDITVYLNQLPPAPPANIALQQAEVSIAFSRNGQIICKAGPYTVTETTGTLIPRRITEQLRRDELFFARLNEAIR